MTCPYRVKPGDFKKQHNLDGVGLLRKLQWRLDGRGAISSTPRQRMLRSLSNPFSQVQSYWHQPTQWKVSAALLKVHSRRVSVINFHPSKP